MDQMARRFEPEAYRRFTEAFRYFELVQHHCIVGPTGTWLLLVFAPDVRGSA
jgi:hypothetical protein